jgi:cytochrome c553
VPPCASCHGPGGERHPLFPSLAGLPRFYVEQQLRLFRAGRHSTTPQAQVMHAAARTLHDDDIRAVAVWYSGLPPEPAAVAAHVPAEPATAGATPTRAAAPAAAEASGRPAGAIPAAGGVP